MEKIKKQKRSCALCKPYKMGWVNRWKAKEFAEIQELEKIKKITKV